jgi:hypothetical protein
LGYFPLRRTITFPYRGGAISAAIRRIEIAEEVVTYNGKNRDLADLGKFAGMPGDLPLNGVHTDMRSICWSDRIWGSGLRDTYLKHFMELPSYPDTYEGDNERDVYMTFKLWELWKDNRLKILDGQ